MKKQFFFSMLAAAAMLASCSSEDAIAPDKGGNEYGMIEGQPAFISLGIAMPDGASTRANDNLDDGAADEYVVKSGRLVLFKGSTEATATLLKDYDITDYIKASSDWSPETSNNHITTTSKKFVQEIDAPNLSGSEKLYAYIILNDKGNATGLTYGVNTPFSTFSKAVLRAIGIADESLGYGAENTTNGFVMTSVPVSTAAGQTSDPSTGTIKTLTPIQASAVYPTKAEAEDAGAAVACCYVERAAVKVQMTFNASIVDPALGAGHYIDVNGVSWGLGNINSNAVNSGYFNTRQVDEAWSPLYNAMASYKYRFVSGTRLFASGHEDGYRTYFGKDVNYDGNTGLIGSTMATWPLASGASTFTYENTFDEDNQKYRNTTYVGLKVQLNGGADFFTIDGQNNTALSEATLKTKLANKIDDQIGTTTIATINSTISSKINADLANSSGVLITSTHFNASDNITYDLKHTVTLGTVRDTEGKITYTDKLELVNVKVNGADATAEQLTAIGNVEYATSQKISEKLAIDLTGYTPEVIYKYVGGIAYYATRIAHFGDTETPWDAPNEAHNDYAKIYPTTGKSMHDTPKDYGASRTAAWLGRWGIVRNNWYKLTITDVQGIGDAVPVDYSGTAVGSPGDTPDDNPKPKYYIAAHIHILPWCLRTQNVIL